MDDGFRRTAAHWHGGQSSPLYVFASTGMITRGLWSEIYRCIDHVERGELGPDADPVTERERLVELLHHVEREVALARARDIGRRRGEAAVETWHHDTLGDRPRSEVAATARRVIRAVEGGDPVVLDSLPGWSDGFSPPQLQKDCGWVEPPLDDYMAHARWDAGRADLWKAYATTFQSTVEDGVARACRAELVGPSVSGPPPRSVEAYLALSDGYSAAPAAGQPRPVEQAAAFRDRLDLLQHRGDPPRLGL